METGSLAANLAAPYLIPILTELPETFISLRNGLC